MKHALIEASTKEQIAVAEEAADWLVSAAATSAQDRRLLRGEPEEDTVLTEAIYRCGIIACLRAIKAISE